MKALLLAGLGLVVLPAVASAQITDFDVATATLEVVAGISISKTDDINFGNIAPGQGTVTMDAEGNLTSGTGITSQTPGVAGEFSVTGFPTAVFDITAVADLLVNLDGPGDITFTPHVYGNGTDDAAAANTAGQVTGGTIAGGGTYFIYVGGVVVVDDTEATGTYEGDVTVTVDYTSV